MGGLFGVVSKQDCVNELFYGTDYHSHLGTVRGGLAVRNSQGFTRFIHDITGTQFRSKFEDDITRMHGNSGIGVISDYEDQPLIIGSHLGLYAIVTVGKINNLNELVQEAFERKNTHFTEMNRGEVNPTELVATLINQGSTFEEGIRIAQKAIRGSCSLLLLTEKGLYAARDFHGRTPVILGRGENSRAVTMETCAFPNLDYEVEKELGPGEIVLVTPDGIQTLLGPEKRLQICAFLWVYYGYPASTYEGINVEAARNRCGRALAVSDLVKVDVVAGVPDSGTAHAIGYANEARVPYQRPFVKYTPTWPRSFIPQNQKTRDLVARMKLIPIRELIEGKRLLFCEDSIVRGTQLRNTIARLFDFGAREVHMRPACPPLIYNCEFLNFSRSRSIMDLAARKAIQDLDGNADDPDPSYSVPGSDRYAAMVEHIRSQMGVTTLVYQRLENLVTAIGLPMEKVCTCCWNGCKIGD